MKPAGDTVIHLPTTGERRRGGEEGKKEENVGNRGVTLLLTFISEIYSRIVPIDACIISFIIHEGLHVYISRWRSSRTGRAKCMMEKYIFIVRFF